MAERLDLVVKNGTVVLGAGRFRVAVGVKNGKVAALGPEELLPPAKEEIDAAGLFVLPGVVDSEAHPGCYVPFRHDMTTEFEGGRLRRHYHVGHPGAVDAARHRAFQRGGEIE